MSFNLNFFKGATLTQAQNALQYWLTALRPAEEVDKLKQEKEEEIVANVVVQNDEGKKADDDEKEEPSLVIPALCQPETNINLYS